MFKYKPKQKQTENKVKKKITNSQSNFFIYKEALSRR